MTRLEYANTIRDLLGIGSGAATSLSIDEKAGLFDSNLSAPVTELQLEQYQAAAEAIANEAVQDLGGLLKCDTGATGEDGCASRFVREFGRRAYRRPLENDELARFDALYSTGRSAYDFGAGIRLVVQAMLQSPNFLYHVEAMPTSVDEDDVAALSSFELAGRLSYFLWGSMPDDELLDAAESGQLESPAALESQARRMMDDPRARDTLAAFHVQWLGLDRMDTLEKDPQLFPEFDQELREAMKTELQLFADDVIRQGDGQLETLLTAPYTYSGGPLNAMYGLPDAPSDAPFERVELDETQRAGVLTQIGTLSMTAHATQTSPVRRGKLVRASFLCQAPPPPPANVDTTPPRVDPNLPTKERFAEHSKNPECKSCHELMDPIGYGFENFDPIGRYRVMDGNGEVDATGEFLYTDDIDGAFDGPVELAHKLADSRQVSECVALQWFRFATGRTESKNDECSIANLQVGFEESGHNIPALLLDIVKSDVFRYRRATLEGD